MHYCEEIAKLDPAKGAIRKFVIFREVSYEAKIIYGLLEWIVI